MRDIKFRAWDKKRKIIVKVEVMSFAEGGGTFVPMGKTLVDNYCESLSEVELLQYTGLLDKHGKEIYEGDILKKYYILNSSLDFRSYWKVLFGEYDNSEIEYGSGGNIGFYGQCFKMEDGLNYSEIGEQEGLNNIGERIEIIGNIYENQELL